MKKEKPKPPRKNGRAVVLPNARAAKRVEEPGKDGYRKIADPKDRILSDMRMYYNHTDWGEMWEDFYLSVTSTEDGNKYRYRSIHAFAREKAQSAIQYEFLIWYLGKNNPDDTDCQAKCVKYSYVKGGPVDWADKRNNGGWFTNKSLRAISNDIARRMTALDALRELGNTYSLIFCARAAQLATKIDEAFRGSMFVPGNTFRENETRARSYLKLQQECLDYYMKSQRCYAEAHGVNFEDMAGIVQLMQATAIQQAAKQAGTERAVTTAERATTAVVEMIMTKAAEYKIPLPEAAEAKILEAVSEDATERVFKKNRTN